MLYVRLLRSRNPACRSTDRHDPQTYVELTDDQAIKDLHRTLDLLDDDDDVTDVWTNWDE